MEGTALGITRHKTHTKHARTHFTIINQSTRFVCSHHSWYTHKHKQTCSYPGVTIQCTLRTDRATSYSQFTAATINTVTASSVLGNKSLTVVKCSSTTRPIANPLATNRPTKLRPATWLRQPRRDYVTSHGNARVPTKRIANCEERTSPGFPGNGNGVGISNNLTKLFAIHTLMESAEDINNSSILQLCRAKWIRWETIVKGKIFSSHFVRSVTRENTVKNRKKYFSFHCFTVHFNSLNYTYQLMHFYIKGVPRVKVTTSGGCSLC